MTAGGVLPVQCGDEPGQWRPVGVVSCTPPPTGGSDPFAWAAKVKPFVVESNEQFLSKGPNALTSGLYAKEYNEVKALGVAGLVRTGEQLAVFNFFQANPVEMFSRSFRTYALAQGLDLVEQARLFGLFGLAGGDTNITCWEDKAHWSFWRPQTAIRLADTDGNPKTEKVDGWTSAIATPAVPRPFVGVQLQHRHLYDDCRALLRTRPHELHRLQPERDDAGVPTLPRRVGGHDRCPRLSRHPLPLARRGGRENRPRRRPLGREARAATASSNDEQARVGGGPRKRVSSRCCQALRMSPASSTTCFLMETTVLALTTADRESILRALDDPPTDALAELRATLLLEHEWRVREGLV